MIHHSAIVINYVTSLTHTSAFFSALAPGAYPPRTDPYKRYPSCPPARRIFSRPAHQTLKQLDSGSGNRFRPPFAFLLCLLLRFFATLSSYISCNRFPAATTGFDPARQGIIAIPRRRVIGGCWPNCFSQYSVLRDPRPMRAARECLATARGSPSLSPRSLTPILAPCPLPLPPALSPPSWFSWRRRHLASYP